MSDEINIDFADSEPEWIKAAMQMSRKIDDDASEIAQLREQLSAERRLNAELRRELDELHARHRPKEDQ